MEKNDRFTDLINIAISLIIEEKSDLFDNDWYNRQCEIFNNNLNSYCKDYNEVLKTTKDKIFEIARDDYFNKNLLYHHK